MAKPQIRDTEGAAPATLATAVFEKLRLDILDGHIPPGEKLRIEALRERYEVGASPLREALNRLTAMGLVEQVDQRGFRVPAVSVDEFDELTRTRCWVNEVTIREAVAHGDQQWEENIVLAYHRLWRSQPVLPGGGLNREWALLHRKFHAALIAACPSKWMRGFHETLFDYADRHRHLYALSEPSSAPIADEHRQIMEAVVKRDADLAIQLLNTAILSLRPRITFPGESAVTPLTAPGAAALPRRRAALAGKAPAAQSKAARSTEAQLADAKPLGAKPRRRRVA